MSTLNQLVLTVADGTRMHAYTAQPQAPTAVPSLILFQEASGVNQHIRSVAESTSGLGLATSLT